MKKRIIIIILFISFTAPAQTISGNLKNHAGQQISLTGFNYYKNYELANASVDSLGNFVLNYPKEYKGMAILKTQDKSSIVFVLVEPTIYLKGNHLTETDSLQFTNSLENNIFVKYAKEQRFRGNAVSALDFLDPLYQNQLLFAKQKKFLKKIKKEQARLQKEDMKFFSNLPHHSYARWFIPHRKFIHEMPIIVRRKTEKIPNAINQFRNIDFNNTNFKTSGLFKEVVEGHYLLLENMGQSLDSMYVQMNLSSTYLINNLQKDEVLLNEVSAQLFDYFEKRSLFKASEYLSVTLLNQNQLRLNDHLIGKLEGYRKLKVGAIAPDIQLTTTKKLSDIQRPKLVIFGASWCLKCKTDTKEIFKLYDTWKAKNIEIVYISIDTAEQEFEAAYGNMPWKTYCDFKGWATQAAKDYYISGTPSYFLLDVNNKILVRPNTVLHANVWIERKL
jgi:thiol-disulfide isomerase/thioredoxin